MGPSWAQVGLSNWAPNGPQLGPNGAHLGMLLGYACSLCIGCDCNVVIAKLSQHNWESTFLHCDNVISQRCNNKNQRSDNLKLFTGNALS